MSFVSRIAPRRALFIGAGACVLMLAGGLLLFFAPQIVNAITVSRRPPLPVVSAQLLQALHSASLRDIGRAPAPAQDGILAVQGAQLHAGKPLVLYVGAEYCPYCAIMRWPLVMALMRFGTFSDLKLTRSSATDTHPDTATFSFVGARYDSPWIDLQAIELSDRDGHRLERPTWGQRARFRRLDAPPYAKGRGAIPFIDMGDRWIIIGAPDAMDPALLHGLDWDGVADRLNHGSGPLWQAMLGETDQLTRKLCELTRGQPVATCAKLHAEK